MHTVSILRQVLSSSFLLMCLLGAAPKPPSPLTGLLYLVGSWSCVDVTGSQRTAYPAKYAVALGGSWLRESDRFADGETDEATITFEPKPGLWKAIVIDGEGTIDVLLAKGSDPRHIVYHSVYPDDSISEIFDRLSPTRFTLHFEQRTGRKIIKSVDTCVKG